MAHHALDALPTWDPDGATAVMSLTGASGADIDYGGRTEEWGAVGQATVDKINVQGIAETVTITGTHDFRHLTGIGSVGTKGALVITSKDFADGSGTTGSAITKTYSYAVITGFRSGPTFEGRPTYQVIFRCKPGTLS